MRHEKICKRNAFMFEMAPPVIIDGKRYETRFDPIAFAVRHNPGRMFNVTNALYSIQAKVAAELDDINGDIAYSEITRNLRIIIDLVR